MPVIPKQFREAVLAAAQPVSLNAAGITRSVYDVSKIPGAERLPRALVTLLENVVRREAGSALLVDSRACPCSSTSRRCVTPWSRVGETPRS